MNVLVLGGTRYFGKRLVELMIKKGHNVTLATRGATPDSFGNGVDRKVVDRSDRAAMATLATGRSWDVVVDQICYSPNEAAIACELFKDQVGRYVHTSTGSVYLTEGNRPESDFDPYSYPIRMGNRPDFDYGEGKRLAEAVFFQKAEFPVVAMRIPIVLGPDDYTGRFEFHIDRVKHGKPIVIPDLKARTSFIHSAEAARFLLWLVEGTVTGPINACCDGSISIQEILDIIGRQVNRKAEIVSRGPESDFTSFTDEKSRCLDTSRAKGFGFEFQTLLSWFPGLVEELSERGGTQA